MNSSRYSFRTVTSLLRQSLVCVSLCLAASHFPTAHGQKLQYAFTNLAGLPGGWGSADGAGRAAGFNRPSGVAVDASGNVYVADTYNATVRKVTPEGIVTTLAGSAGQFGYENGKGTTVRFGPLAGVAVTRSGQIYVADGRTIRRLSPEGVVTTLAGGELQPWISVDGIGTNAAFSSIGCLALDGENNILVGEGPTLRKVTEQGVVTTLAGKAGVRALLDGDRITARLFDIHGVALDQWGNTYLADSFWLRKVSPDGSVSTLRKDLPQFGALAGDPEGNLYLTFSSVIRKQTRDRRESVLAGDPNLAGSADGVGDAARFKFNYSQALAIDGAGNLFVADDSTIRKITPDASVTTLAGRGTTEGMADGHGSAARFNRPSAVAVDEAGSVYVVDSGNQSIRKITAAGEVTTLAGDPSCDEDPGLPLCRYADGKGNAARFHFGHGYIGPTVGIAVDKEGSVFVADTVNSVIRKITPDGVVTTLAGKARDFGYADGAGSAARFRSPLGLAVDPRGIVYVADTGNSTIRKVTPDGTVTTLAGQAPLVDEVGQETPEVVDGTGQAARFIRPRSLAVDGAGNVFVVDADSNSRIRKITPEGVVTTVVTAAQAQSAGIEYPGGIAVDGGGNLYVGSWNTVVKLAPNGVATTIAGRMGLVGWEDGIGGAARFNGLVGVAVDPSGNLYVADSGNNRITKGTPLLVSEPCFKNMSIVGRTLTVTVTGLVPGVTVVLESSANLRDWSEVQTNTFSTASWEIRRQIESGSTAEFLRATVK